MAMLARTVAMWQLFCQTWRMPSGSRPLPSPLSLAIARLLNEAISESAASQRAIAERAGISPAQLSRVLNGLKVFTIDQLDAVCDAVGTDLVDLIERAELATSKRTDLRLVANESINEFPEGDDADYDQA